MMAIISLIQTILVLFSFLVLYIGRNLLVNYRAARKTGLPLVVLPFDTGYPLWMIVDRKVVQLCRRLPFGSGTFTRFNCRGWEILDRYKAHEELGDAIIFVTPGKNYLQLCDAEAVADIFHRRVDFPRPPEATSVLNIFGPNLGTTDGAQWQRHRKITASCFNEQVMQRVWKESISQATGMIQSWSRQDAIKSVALDTRMVSLHVMSGAIFGKSYPFRGASEDSVDSSEEDSSSYGKALKLILDRCIPLFVLGRNNLKHTWLPRSLRELHRATVVFQNHMTEAFEAEKQNLGQKNQSEGNLMTALVRASQGGVHGKQEEGLTEEEVYGNIFVYNFAGHDATANSLAIGICLLATRPHVQEWIAEEINAVLGSTKPAESVYGSTFARLHRCMAVVYEIVRLYTAVAIMKTTGSSPQSLKLGSTTVELPPNTAILPNYSALHTHPRYWGSNSLDFDPSRWITSDPINGTETFDEPASRNSPFVGWSGGARNCPGRKFTQVEFVGVLVALFQHHKVRPVALDGESEEMARARLWDQIANDTGMRLLLQMLHPEKAVLQWTKR